MEKKFEDDEIEIDMGELFAVVRHKIKWIVIIGVICGAIGFCVSYFLMTPMYKSSTKIYVLSKQNSDGMSYNDLQMSAQLAEDCASLIKSRTVTGEVIEQLQLDMTDEELAECIDIGEVSSSGRVIEISVTYPEASVAQKIADTIREVSADNFLKIMEVQAVNTVEVANIPKKPSSPSVKKYTLLGLFAGVFLSIIVVIIMHITNNKLCTRDDVEKYLGLSVLGVMPDSDEGMNNEELVKAYQSKRMPEKKQKKL